MGDGVIAFSIFGKTNFIFPYMANSSTLLAVKELDAYRIVEIKRVKNVIIGIGELQGKTNRFTLVFNPTTYSYQIRIEEADALGVNFVVLDKGVVVAQNGDKAELFFNTEDGVAKYKVVDKFPLTKGQQLFSFNNDVYFTHEKGLFKIALKTK